MRFITLVTYCVINTVFLASSDAVAATHASGKRTSASHSSAKHHGKKKGKLGPTDVWERVRAGMQLPRPHPVTVPAEYLAALQKPPLPESTSTSSNTPLTTNKATPATAKTERKTEPDSHKINVPETTLAKQKNNENEFDNTNSEAIEAKYTSSNLSKQQPTASEQKTPTTCSENKREFVPSKTYTPKKRIHTQIDFAPGLQDHRTNIISESIDDRVDDATDERIDSASDVEFPIKLSKPCKPTLKEIHLATLDSKATPEYSTDESTTQELSPQEIAQLVKQAENYARVNNFITRYSQQTGYLKLVAERARPYLYHVVESLRQYKLPTELALLPIVESSYQPTALSPKSAAGLWQFIPSTGADYNLKQTEFYDERLDIASSTNAAMRFLTFLKQHFHGDWLLAIAAYNCGPGRVDDAIQQNRANGLGTDYWSLQLPEETQNYVPRLLALAAIFSDPGAYKLKLNPIRNEPYFLRVKIDRDIDVKNLANKDLRAVAELANLSLEQFTTLNPGFLNSKLSNEKSFTMLMPGANAEQLHQRLDMLAELVTNNDKTTPNVVMEVENPPENNWQSPPAIPYLSLNVTNTPPATTAPTNVKPADEASNSTTKTESYKIHHLDKGDTLASLAKQYQVSIEDILAANKFIGKPTLTPGQRLKIPVKSLRNILDMIKS